MAIRKRQLIALLLLLSCGRQCSLYLPRGGLGWSVIVIYTAL